MSEGCAVCGADEVYKRITLPDGWAAYLAEQRGLDRPEGYYLLPTCADCSGDVDMQVTLDETMERMDEDTADLLDDLALEALVDETGDAGV